ncbi:MAG: DUF1186 domain-containing protein [Verrucomicrobia bacterium]|jgi:tetratricopeptide (TPR) repeat protein|nr:DUF1186 domain-containing protein [Verrucomicrobiota bacterium]MBT7067765.1 DUF1186 domain-containing protein [Verrucomicrobiota bacterium]MBT7699200.1 DUF1186 domain-containing protein [Verrucomicrobiota bacterium]
MNITAAIDALRPFTSKVPSEALDSVREHWDEAEPVLLGAIEERLVRPLDDDKEALFLYAIHLCAEMRCARAFPLYVRIARLPNALLDHLMGDILTESLDEMLARTCDGRIDEIKALIEDPSLNEFARTEAMDSLRVLLFESVLSWDDLSAYCVEALSEKLERRPGFIWNGVISVARDIQAKGALPLIEKAYERGLADPGVEELSYIQAQYQKPLPTALLEGREMYHPFDSTEAAMSFFVHQWGKKDDGFSDLELLEVLNERPKVLAPPTRPATGRNDPCPCGSGKKYKKCCIDKGRVTAPQQRLSANGNPIDDKHIIANDWMEAGYLHSRKKHSSSAFECWKRCWEELRSTLPAELQDPTKAEDMGAFEGTDFLVNWLQDFEMLLGDVAENNAEATQYAVQYLEEIPNRFQDLESDIKRNMQADRSRCLANLGQQDQAIALLEEMIRDQPDHAQGYVELSDMHGFHAAILNVRPDIPRAIRYLQQAQQHAEDCADYDVVPRLTDLNVMNASMEKPLL